jgi:class 3 adenylate cyclase
VEDIVFTYEGTLEKYIGDALLAIWGAPYSRPDDTDRAVQVAIEMQHAVQRLNQDWQDQGRQPIAIHIGLNSGPVAAGNIGSRRLIQYAAIGDTTNVTSRICDVAKAGEIILAASTVKRLNYKDYPLIELPPTKVKGKKEPLQLYRLEWRELPSLHEVTSHSAHPKL